MIPAFPAAGSHGAFLAGSIVNHLCRACDNGDVEELRKAQRCLDRLLAFVEGRETPLQMDVLLGFREPPAPGP